MARYRVQRDAAKRNLVRRDGESAPDGASLIEEGDIVQKSFVLTRKKVPSEHELVDYRSKDVHICCPLRQVIACVDEQDEV